ncbi:EF hand [Gimesia panareensis]|uniref:EF hand n=1 Tax=Gimesia panareensis TaxID=2527978 RepID=A0A517Q2U9_9PLAN|nr:hypothetical protein [Gimesia panareensis]QDT25951.1 EF hand [Gimesia panareensis]
MRIALIFTLAILIVGTETQSGETKPQPPATTVLELREADHPHMIDVQVTVDGQPFDDYWTSIFNAIFDFADTDDNGVLNEQEIRLVPSARAVRLSLGNAFTPPVAAIQSLNEILTDPSQKCTKEQLRQYYQRHGAGRLLIGSGKLPHTAALTQALLQALDADKDQRLSRTELQRAETALRRLDTNDDELIGVGELVPNATYPGSWAANALQTGSEVNLSPSGQPRLVLKRRNTQLTSHPDDKAIWQISVADRLTDQPLQVSTSKTRCLSWSIPGPINPHFPDDFLHFGT